MRATTRWLLAAGVLALCGGPATAQPGFGGFGGGGQLNLRTGLFTNKALQEELKVTDEQATKLKMVAAKQAEALKPYLPPPPPMGQPGGFGGRGGFGGPQIPRDDEGALEYYKTMAKVTEDRIAATKTILSADQQKRLAQLENQQLGTAAFTTARVVKALGLTEEETKKIQELNDEMNKERMELQRDAFSGGFDQEKMQELQKKIRTLTDDTVGKIEKSLSTDQQKKWKEMKGEAFDFGKLTPRPPM